MMKKLIALLLAMIMVLSLVACSGQTAAAFVRFPGRFRYHKLFSERNDCS